MDDIRDSLRNMVDKKGLRHKYIADRAGMTQQQLCDVFSKRRKLDANELLAICSAADVTLNELAEYTKTN